MKNALRFLFWKLVLLLTVVVGVTTLMFFLTRATGDPAVLLSPPEASDEVVEANRVRLGLDEPLLLQFWHTLLDTFTFNFGNSFVSGQDVGADVLGRLGPSLALVVPGLVLAAVLAGVIGTYAALHQADPRGRLLMAAAFLLDGIPYFLIALLLVLVLALQFNVLPATGGEGGAALVIPIAVLTIQGFATLSRLTRGQLIDSLSQGPVTMAKSKGLPARTVLFKHAVPLALPPLIAYLGILFSFMIGSLLILESILNYPGLGQFLVRSVGQRDFPAVQASVIVIAVLITVVNIAMDTLVRVLDPRLRTKVS
ncbi:ABC transporter permease [Nocardioides jishulii]|uniref:ABC transporter permease n=1 Tax=Nocardioides jishulii TaxID=2575440 RepID=A0A4U2YHW6_9ACTN|nr:ABC transporter permease [Nocardioides jishulii]QCX28002.1 ABC transporter permease [Nocardioides jishulii]TKI60666.1 ABC transporter permease [Nocardioides jishulii]